MKTRAVVVSLCIVVLVFAYAVAQGQQRASAAPAGVIGRFQIVSSGSEPFLLDTQQGHVWDLVRITDSKIPLRVWSPVPGGVESPEATEAFLKAAGVGK
jgi:hypothetical protein